MRISSSLWSQICIQTACRCLLHNLADFVHQCLGCCAGSTSRQRLRSCLFSTFILHSYACTPRTQPRILTYPT